MFRKNLLSPCSVLVEIIILSILQNVGNPLPAITRRHRLNMNIQSGVFHNKAENLIFSSLCHTICENNLVGLLVCAEGN
jgi:hypothetical protein